jgi:glycosyltransferase involved in cell wall biosynthesis
MKKSVYDVSVVVALNRIDEFTFLAIDSVIKQKDVIHQVVIVVNGSNCDILASEISSKYGTMSCVKIVSISVGQLSCSLNLGISQADSDYIARMDADDLSEPYRLRFQLDYLNRYNLDLVGCDVDLIDVNGSEIGSREFPRRKTLHRSLLYKNSFCHPSVLFKKSKILECRGYNSGFNSEDYDLWLRLRSRGVAWDNMEEKLLKYRVHPSSTQGSILAYCECCGLFMREFLLKPSFSLFFAFLFSIMKYIKARLQYFSLK